MNEGRRSIRRVAEPRRRASGERAGFTLVELLVVAAVVALLVGIALPTIGHARRSAERARELASLHAMTAGYIAAATERDGELMPGFITGPIPSAFALRSTPPIAKDESGNALSASDFPSGGSVQAAAALARYPWRLAPYIGGQVSVMFRDRGALDRLSGLSRDLYLYGVSEHVGFGLNQRFLGGDYQEYGFDTAAARFWGKSWAARRLTDVRSPSMQIVFAASATRNVPSVASSDSQFYGEPLDGYFKVVAPRFFQGSGKDWTTSPTGRPGAGGAFPPLPPARQSDTSRYGFVSSRDGLTAAGMLDGSAAQLEWSEALDMRRWTSQADRPDWQLPRPAP